MGELDVQKAQERLRAWANDFSVGRYEKPQYANPGELKRDLLTALDRVAALEAENEKLAEDACITCQARDAENEKLRGALEKHHDWEQSPEEGIAIALGGNCPVCGFTAFAIGGSEE
jgi:hypothetical protein